MNRPPSPHPRRLKTIYEEEKMNKNVTQDIVSVLFKEVNELRDIVKNLEEEQKRKLFDQKVRELRDVFESAGLDELHSLKFEKNVNKIEKERLRLVGEGNGEGSYIGGDSQGTNDKGVEDDEEGGSIQTDQKEK